jgi:hypothetical protein
MNYLPMGFNLASICISSAGLSCAVNDGLAFGGSFLVTKVNSLLPHGRPTRRKSGRVDLPSTPVL